MRREKKKGTDFLFFCFLWPSAQKEKQPWDEVNTCIVNVMQTHMMGNARRFVQKRQSDNETHATKYLQRSRNSTITPKISAVAQPKIFQMILNINSVTSTHMQFMIIIYTQRASLIMSSNTWNIFENCINNFGVNSPNFNL